jgi:hypothetical protein
MERVWLGSVRVLSGALIIAMYATRQTYTVSARPGAVNYIEGTAYIDGAAVSAKAAKTTFLSANSTLSTDSGKVEVLLTPGVFLRLGENSEVRMISPSLTNTRVELNRGEAMIEAAGLLKDNNIEVINHGASITLEKNGLYRFRADNQPTAAVLEGKAEVRLGDRKLNLSKNRQTVLSESLKAEKFDPKQPDELYAWSNVRSQYQAAASYSAANSAIASNYGAWGGYAGSYTPGWFWNAGFDSWAWLPGDGAFFSPFGYGFYGPGLVGYAPVVVAPVRGNGQWNHGADHWRNRNVPVPVNGNNPPAVGSRANSPWADHVARQQAARSLSESGFRTGGGTPAPAFSGHNGWGGARPVGNGGGGVPGGAGGAHAAGGGGGNAGGAGRMAGGVGGHGPSHQ